MVGGIGNFSKVDLSKALAGKRASVGAGVSATTETVSGSCSPKDFETMMQLTYLTFTAPRKDNEAFESYKNRMKAELQNADANPMTAFSDTVSYALYGNHPRSFSMKENMVDKIDYDRVMEMYKDRFKDASDFTFYFVGNIDVEKMKPMIAKYLGGLHLSIAKRLSKIRRWKSAKVNTRTSLPRNKKHRWQPSCSCSTVLANMIYATTLLSASSIRHWIWFTPQKSVRKKAVLMA